MTAAGVATLFITKTMLGVDAPTDCDFPPAPDLALRRGLKYLGDNFSNSGMPIYTWYGIDASAWPAAEGTSAATIGIRPAPRRC